MYTMADDVHFITCSHHHLRGKEKVREGITKKWGTHDDCKKQQQHHPYTAAIN